MHQILAHAMTQKARKKGWIDIPAGFALMRHPNVPVGLKIASVALGAAATVLLVLFEIPLEGLVSLLLPFVGVAADFVFDGIEFLLLPLLLAATLLPHLVAASARKNRL